MDKNTARLVQTVNGLATSTLLATSEIVAEMAARGFALTGTVSNPRLRAELQGAPKFKGVAGPMWDGDRLRYECSATCAANAA